MPRTKRISFTVTGSDYYLVRAYIREKRRWKDAAALARDALFQHIARNPLSEAQVARVGQEQGEGGEAGLAVLRGGSGGKE
jgi:hypothetical protein